MNLKADLLGKKKHKKQLVHPQPDQEKKMTQINNFKKERGDITTNPTDTEKVRGVWHEPLCPYSTTEINGQPL